ncbi:bifunctional diaminohydroxyphosphoribosylaminopyrimidine deaminase/5-amino-6-(5-phosphoribosylamino)uracil reductase RibD [Streptomyces marincola]|uniref:Riboflavin biosynthesis protein RibD n=1 Tax=Streptomyces marincola TaxID=2878388 RepID=A0A1W7CT66_9ACTN|nr:bifunctional diaminohydroxyphosphoribosylaminopyrimidine deaminase/5-amino-6-(5-phosphoribosylamino)uracil reductase RibD [Streptomyces marincola]ARQ68003.1 riboflavin biosynthesis protein RibD [Streptomyces marincola]
MASPEEVAAMRRAIAVSAQGLGTASPNPPVGCVVLDRHGRTVGEGYHARKGEPHAEVNALAAAGRSAAGGTAVVTLEPRNHHGRTPPCRAALIDAGVTRVLIAVRDPTSRGEGGAAVLRQAGLEVETGLLRQEALLILGPWLASLRAGRPYITWAYSATSDGVPLGPPVVGAPADLAALRAAHDLVLTPEGRLTEGLPGGHGDGGVFHVPRMPTEPGPAEAMDTLRAAGARSLLVEGTSRAAMSLLAACPADRVVAHLPRTLVSRAPCEGTAAVAALPEGYRIVDVALGADHIGLTADRE